MRPTRDGPADRRRLVVRHSPPGCRAGGGDRPMTCGGAGRASAPPAWRRRGEAVHGERRSGSRSRAWPAAADVGGHLTCSQPRKALVARDLCGAAPLRAARCGRQPVWARLSSVSGHHSVGWPPLITADAERRSPPSSDQTPSWRRCPRMCSARDLARPAPRATRVGHGAGASLGASHGRRHRLADSGSSAGRGAVVPALLPAARPASPESAETLIAASAVAAAALAAGHRQAA